MSDIDEIDIGQINSLRSHLKKLHSTTEYLQRYCRWNYYKPHPETQLPFHNAKARERSIVLGSQQGKTTAASFEMAFAACDVWPAWHVGLHPAPPKIERAANFIGWYCSISSQTVRDNDQLKLLGDISQKDGLGTGAIPLDFIRGVTMSRGIANFVDTITLLRETGGTALLQSRTFEQSVLAYQGVPVDLSWIDEDPGYDDRLYGELLARSIATNGRIICSLTPMLGLTPIRKRFKEGGSGLFEIRGGIEQALHISPEARQEIIDRTPERERAARIWGHEMQGEGAVFTIPLPEIQHERRHETFPPHWPVAWACDFSHGGLSASAHPFAAVFAFYDPVNDVIYVCDALKMKQQLPDQHVSAMKAHPIWDAPCLWPHDGNSTAQATTGETLARMYKRLGLNMQPGHTTFPNGGYSFEVGIADMERRLATGRLRIAKWLDDWNVEYMNYHYEKGQVKKIDDDLMSATRQLCMGIRHARAISDLGHRTRGFNQGSQIAPGRDFDLFRA